MYYYKPIGAHKIKLDATTLALLKLSLLVHTTQKVGGLGNTWDIALSLSEVSYERTHNVGVVSACQGELANYFALANMNALPCQRT